MSQLFFVPLCRNQKAGIMNRIVVEIDKPSNVRRFTDILEDLKYVRNFTPEKDDTDDLTPLTDDDWSKPGRPATDEEMEQLAIAMDQEYETEQGMTSEEAKLLTMEKIANL